MNPDLKLELLDLLSHMEVPLRRMKLNPEDIRWLNRNLHIRNNGLDVERAREIIAILLREMI